jgi:hypothetical protein
MAGLSWCARSANRVLTVFHEWFGSDRVQTSVILVGIICICAAVVFEVVVPWTFGSLVFVSVGTSIVATGIVFRVTQKKDIFQDAVQKAGVLFVGDRNAFNEVIGWDRWIVETRRCAELIIIGKDQIKWAEDSAAAIASVLARNVEVTFIFQGDQCEQRLSAFWDALKGQDTNGQFMQWRSSARLKLCKYRDEDGDYGYYWNGEKLIVKLYFDVANKRDAPFIVFNVSFAAGKFDDEDFSVASLTHIPFSDKKKMLVQVGANMCKIIRGATIVPLS